MSDDEFTSRPQAKRVRSDRDHSKADTKNAEDDRTPKSEQKKKGKDENGDDKENEDEDWLAKSPFQVGKSWEGWKTKWRESCWCGKSGSMFHIDFGHKEAQKS